MATRRQIFNALCQALGADPVDPSDGWPGTARFTLPSGAEVLTLVHAAPITTHSRGLPGEVRLQPPGQNKPVQDDGVSLPLLLGVSEDSDVIVAAPANRHVGRNERWTVTFREDLIAAARERGWATIARPIQPYGDEEIWALQTPLLPVFVEMLTRGALVEETLLQAATIGSGLPAEPHDPEAQERARVATSRLVRDAAFGGAVNVAYDGRCAMCGLGFGLVESAHVYPVSATGSEDTVWNGICLCENHHRAFDRHLIHVDPGTLHITLHPSFVAAASEGDPAAQAFLDLTRPILAPPGDPSHRVRSEMLERRYQYFQGSYDWV